MKFTSCLRLLVCVKVMLMSRNYYRDDPVADAEDHANRPLPIIGKCVECGKVLARWDIRYEIEDDLICDDCIYDWLAEFRKDS